MSSKHYELDRAIKEIEQLFKSTELIPKLYHSVENISRILCAIIKTNGENWLNELNDLQLNSIERVKLNNVFRPYIPFILSFFNGKMKGGVNEVKTEEIDAEIEEVKDINDTSEESAKYGPDDLTDNILDTFRFIDSIVNKVATSDFGILKMEKDSDDAPDMRLFPDFITKPIYGINPVISKGLEQVKLPFRMIVTIVYLLLDIARMISATTGNDMNRNILSVVIAVLDLLRGDWKKAIMTIMGYFGTTPLFMGQLGKVYLTLFQTLSPNIQNNFIFGTVDAVKSLIIGILLAVFKIAAPYEVRRPIIEVFDTIAKHKEDIDGTLEAADLKPLPEYMAPTFNDFNNLQALMDDPAFICSSEHQELVKTIDNSAIIHIVLQLLRIPVTDRFREYHCGTEMKSFVERIVERQSKPIKIPQKGPTGEKGVNEVVNEVKGATGENEVANEVVNEVKGATGENGVNEVKGATGENGVNEVKGATGENEVNPEVVNKVEDEVKGATGENGVKNEVNPEVNGATGENGVNPEAGVTGTMVPMQQMYPPMMYPPMYQPMMYPPQQMYPPQMYPPPQMQPQQMQPPQMQPPQMQPPQPSVEQKGGNARKLRRSYST